MLLNTLIQIHQPAKPDSQELFSSWAPYKNVIKDDWVDTIRWWQECVHRTFPAAARTRLKNAWRVKNFFLMFNAEFSFFSVSPTLTHPLTCISSLPPPFGQLKRGVFKCFHVCFSALFYNPAPLFHLQCTMLAAF